MNYIYNLSKKADTGTEDTINYLFALEKLNAPIHKMTESNFYIKDSSVLLEQKKPLSSDSKVKTSVSFRRWLRPSFFSCLTNDVKCQTQKCNNIYNLWEHIQRHLNFNILWSNGYLFHITTSFLLKKLGSMEQYCSVPNVLNYFTNPIKTEIQN